VRASGVQKRYFNERGWAIMDALEQISQARGATVAQIALAWLLSRPSVTSPIIGANRPGQLHDALGAIEVTLTSEEIRQLRMQVPGKDNKYSNTQRQHVNLRATISTDASSERWVDSRDRGQGHF